MKIRWTKQAEGEETEVFLEKGTAIPETFQKLGKKRGGDCRIAVKKEGFSEEEWTKMLCNGVCSLYDGAYQFSKSGLKSLGKQSVYENRDSLSDYGDNCYTFVLEGTEQEIARWSAGKHWDAARAMPGPLEICRITTYIPKIWPLMPGRWRKSLKSAVKSMETRSWKSLAAAVFWQSIREAGERLPWWFFAMKAHRELTGRHWSARD